MFLWVSEAVPLGLTALFVFAALGTVPYDRAATFAGFASPVVFFLIGAVAIATAVESTGLARRIASLLIRRARGSPRRFYVQMLVMLPGLAFVLPSAITRNAVLIPAYRDALNAMGMAGSERTGCAIMLALGVLNQGLSDGNPGSRAASKSSLLPNCSRSCAEHRRINHLLLGWTVSDLAAWPRTVIRPARLPHSRMAKLIIAFAAFLKSLRLLIAQ